MLMFHGTNMKYKIIINALMLAMFAISMVQCGTTETPYRHYAKVEWQSTLLSIILGLAGIAFTFFGIKIVKAILFMCGFQAGSFIAAVYFSAEVAKWLGVSEGRMDMFEFLFPMIVGILVGVLVVFLYRVGLFILAILAGFYLGLYIMSWAGPYMTNRETYKPLILILTPCIFAVLMFLFEEIVTIVYTSLVGSVAICSAIDIFAYTGFNKALRHYWRDSGYIVLNVDMEVLLVSYCFLVIAGCFVQYSLLKEKGGNLLPTHHNKD